ncbi:SDR family NAD(P)-dependent oxidoreductase [Fusobacterium russii]|uniref:SDR family NAD(P)-dependent oxidoreductase n=1 Tax=Fusobacterium russii TaxID=854 RepID=UPI00039F558E|nr:SDR family NAD(P)-dependent oxidoreductase [Fusobacterium russii]
MKIFITGGTSGIGLALAKEYLLQGHDVAICGRSEKKISVLKMEYPELKIYKVDVRNKYELKEAMEDFSSDDLDMMIASAGIYSSNRAKKLNQAELINSLDVNLAGALHALEIGRDIMLKKNKGQLVVISSVAGLLEYPDASVYSKSKRAVNYICEAYREALRGSSIKITNILPGYVETDRLRELNGEDTDKKAFLISEEEATKIILRAINQKKEREIFPKKMKIAISIISRLPKNLINFFFHLLEKENDEKNN